MEFISEAFWAWSFLWGNFLIRNSNNFIAAWLLKISISSCVSFGKLSFSANLSILSK